MRWPWTRIEVVRPPRRESSLDRILQIMERRALEDEYARDHERDVLLNEMHRRLLAEGVDDPSARLKFEAKLAAARAHGWEPRDDAVSE